MNIPRNIIILFFIINGISAIAKWNYLEKTATYKAVKVKHPNITQKQWAIIGRCIYILFGMVVFIIIKTI